MKPSVALEKPDLYPNVNENPFELIDKCQTLPNRLSLNNHSKGNLSLPLHINTENSSDGTFFPSSNSNFKYAPKFFRPS